VLDGELTVGTAIVVRRARRRVTRVRGATMLRFIRQRMRHDRAGYPDQKEHRRRAGDGPSGYMCARGGSLTSKAPNAALQDVMARETNRAGDS
jgi:hypothetical protein